MSVARAKVTGTPVSQRAGRWVRKNMLMDQRKLDAVKRELKVATETEAVDAALDQIAFGASWDAASGPCAGRRARHPVRIALTGHAVRVRHQRADWRAA